MLIRTNNSHEMDRERQTEIRALFFTLPFDKIIKQHAVVVSFIFFNKEVSTYLVYFNDLIVTVHKRSALGLNQYIAFSNHTSLSKTAKHHMKY